MKTKQHLSVVWTDVNWDLEIRNRYPGGCRLDKQILRLMCGRFEPLSLPENTYRSITPRLWRPRPGGFTLVELLVVIAVIAILAGIILPVLANVKTKAKVANTRVEMRGLAAAITAYESEYNRNPASPAAEQASANVDFTFGTKGLTPPPIGPDILNPPSITYNANNSEVVMILMDIDQGVNANHVRNTRKNKFWNAKMTSGAAAGVSIDDYVARDPWGSPYIITIDMNDDQKCLDALYRREVVSSQGGANPNLGYYGLSRPPSATGDNFQLNGPVMIWSAGPDKSCDITVKANAAPNRDNVLSW